MHGLSSSQPALPFLQDSPMALLNVSNLFLPTAGTKGRVLFNSLLFSLSTSLVLCSFAPEYSSGDRNIIFTLQVAPWQTSWDPNSSMWCPNPHCTGTQEYSCAKGHQQHCKMKHLKVRHYQCFWAVGMSACCACSS